MITKNIIESVALFITNTDNLEQSPFDIYNTWAITTGTILKTNEEVNYILKLITDLIIIKQAGIKF